jgi:dolichol-phosphate mannosyltransferase
MHTTHRRLSIVLPTLNERSNINAITHQLLHLQKFDQQLEILFVDDDSADGTADAIVELSQQHPCIRLIRRVGRYGLSSAIKEGILNATGDVVVVMDSDGQHESNAVDSAVETLLSKELDLVVGSRFHAAAEINGLSTQRERNSTWANALARFSLPHYRQLTDYMSGFFALRPAICLPFVRQVDVGGFKFLYELLALSQGQLRVAEVPLQFQPRISGESKLDLAVVWDLGVSILHTLLLRSVPRRAISFGLVGATGILVQLAVNQGLMALGLGFEQALPPAVIVAATSNYLINNAVTYRDRRLTGLKLITGYIKFCVLCSVPLAANVAVATVVFERGPAWWVAGLAGAVVAAAWNYVTTSRAVW